jgi:hypothetical protein
VRALFGWRDGNLVGFFGLLVVVVFKNTYSSVLYCRGQNTVEVGFIDEGL